MTLHAPPSERRMSLREYQEQARTHPEAGAGRAAPTIRPEAAPAPVLTRPAPSVVLPALEWNPRVSELLGLMAQTCKPVPHDRIVKALGERGWTKAGAVQSIGWAQERGWIEHDLMHGYILSGMAEPKINSETGE